MDCERVQELIAPFVNGKLNTDETEEFLKHIDTCADCREELEVSYSLMTAMKQLDEGADLSEDYIQELDEKIEACFIEGLKKKKVRARRRVILAALVFGMLFMTGSTASEKRCERERVLLREIFMSEDTKEKADEPLTEKKMPEQIEKTGK